MHVTLRGREKSLADISFEIVNCTGTKTSKEFLLLPPTAAFYQLFIDTVFSQLFRVGGGGL